MKESIEIWNKTRVLKEGRWPDYFLEDLVGEVPDINISSNLSLVWNCSIHGQYKQVIKNHLKGCLCPKCSRENYEKIRKLEMLKMNKFPNWFMKDLAYEDDKERIIRGEFKIEDNVAFRCEKHGIYFRRINKHLSIGECPKCSRERRDKQRAIALRLRNNLPNWFVNDLSNKEDKERFYNGGLKMQDYVEFRCELHGIYKQKAYSHLAGHGCPTCTAQESYSSIIEYKIEEVFRNLGVEIIRSYRGGISSKFNGFPMELDLYFPQYKVAVECNGLYWHSIEHMSECNYYNAIDGKENYHLMKTELCEEKGIQLIHLFEDDLRDKWDICLNLIKSKLGILKRKNIYARSCKIIKLNHVQAKEFFDLTHINGHGRGESYGLFYKNELVSAILS